MATSLQAYLPSDRRRALARGETLPDRARGAALFADIAGFTPLADELARTLGAQRGAEELTRQINAVYDALIAQVDGFGGSVIGFSGDAIMCWFDETTEDGRQRTEEENASVLGRRSSVRATACALAMQSAMRAFPQLAIKIGIATGPARRFVVGDPALQLIDTLAGDAPTRVTRAEQITLPGEIVADRATIDALGDHARVNEWRVDDASGDQFAVIGNLDLTELALSLPKGFSKPMRSDAPALNDAQLRAWILPAVYERHRAGLEEFSLELRPAAALFAQFDEIDYERDDAGARLDTFVRRAQAIIARHAGALIQLTIGDKGSYLYAAFGAPHAYEDDARRAVNAALELLPPVIASRKAAKQSPTSELEIASQESLAMTQRIGVSRGMMRVGAYGSATRRTYGVIGDATNLAARLMLLAPRGEIRCDYNVYRATNARIAFETLPPVRVKGKAGLVRVYRPTSRQSSVVSRQSEIIGRRAEIATVEKLLDEARGGATRVLIVEGEAGIGKSRLVDELKRLTRERGLTGLVGNGQSIEQQPPYRAWRDVFNSYFELDGAKERAIARQRVESLAAQLIPEHAHRLPVLNDVLGLDIPENDLTQSLDANLRQQNVTLVLTALLRAWTSEHPLVLVLEDAHWLDGLSWQLAIQVTRALSLANAPLLLVIVNRPLDENSAGQKVFAELRALSITQTLALAALAPAEIAALIANRLNVATAALPAPLVALVQARANGNPFFAEELVFNLRDTGVIQTSKVSETSEVSVRILGNLETAQRALPDTLHGLILSRLDRLPPERQFVIKVAAVLGRAFAFAPLHHVVNRYVTVIAQSLKDHLTSLTKADFTFLETLEPDLTYLFKHIITQEAAYQTLLFSQRRELHRIVAEWYEKQLKDASGKMKDEFIFHPSPFIFPVLAYHYRYAEDAEKERHYARLAGEAAARQYANDAAVSYLNRALELTPADDESTRRDLLLAREAIYHIQGKRQAQIADLDALAQIGDAHTQAQVSLRRAKLAIETGDYSAAVAHAQATLDAAHDQSLQTAGQIEWGRALARQAHYAEAREHLTQALALAQSAGSRELQADCLHTLGTILSEEGNYARAQGYFEQALNIRHETSDQRGEGNALHSLGNIAIFQADYARASGYYERAVAIFRKIGARTDEGVALGNLGTVALYQSDYVQAASHYAETLLIARKTGDRRGESNALGNLGIVARYREDYAQSIAYSEQALAIDRAIGHRQGAGRKLNSLGESTRMQGDYGRAKEYYAQSLAIARELGQRRSESIALGNLGLVALGQQDYERALEHYTQALAIARQLGDRDRIGYTLTGLGQARAGVGQLDAAVSALQEAIAVRRKIGQLPLLMESVAGLAQVYLAQGDLPAALTVMQEVFTYVNQAHSLDGANEPLQILLTCYQVLAADHNPRAAEILQTTFNRLRQRAARLPDSTARRYLLDNVPCHREIIKTWAQDAQMSLARAIDEALNKTGQQ